MDDRLATTPPTTARGVMFDDRQLARRARTTLAGADSGQLLTVGDRGLADTRFAVRVCDDDGEVLIRCEPEGAVTRAARARRLASLVLAPNPTFGVGLTLSGRLSLTDGPGIAPLRRGHCACRAKEMASGSTDVVVALRGDHVSAACPRDHPRGLSIAQRSVPISLYADAEPDMFAATLPRMIEHLNENHAEQVRRLAAHMTAMPSSRLIAASLTALSAERATVCWVDGSGAHPATLQFARPAHSLEELAATLRECVLAAACAPEPPANSGGSGG
jgi:Protein of unknown function (DUF2470)